MVAPMPTPKIFYAALLSIALPGLCFASPAFPIIYKGSMGNGQGELSITAPHEASLSVVGHMCGGGVDHARLAQQGEQLVLTYPNGDKQTECKVVFTTKGKRIVTSTEDKCMEWHGGACGFDLAHLTQQ